MRLLPDGVTGESPRRADADEEVTLCFAKHEADEDEEQAHGREQHGAESEACVAETPSQHQPVDVEHEGYEQHDEQVERLTELGDVCLVWVNVWDDQKQQEQSQCDKRYQEHAPEFGHIAVHFIVDVPMRCHLIRQLVPEQESGCGGDEEHQQDEDGGGASGHFISPFFGHCERP